MYPPEVWTILQHDNVYGFGLTYFKERRGVVYRSDKPVVVFFVARKLPPYMVPKEFLIPPRLVVGGVQAITDVVEIGGRVSGSPSSSPLPLQTDRFRPLRSGVSGCAYNGDACTITGPFVDQNGQMYMLTNAHCAGRISFSCEIASTAGNPVLQPSPFDGGVYPNDVIGRVSWSSGQELLSGQASRDIAVIILEPYVSALPYLANTGYVQNGQIRDPSMQDIGTTVVKSGRTTGLTFGVIYALNVAVKTYYNACGTSIVTNAVATTKMIEEGDSGSGLYGIDGTFLGLFFATSEGYSFAIPASRVQELGLTPVKAIPPQAPLSLTVIV